MFALSSPSLSAAEPLRVDAYHERADKPDRSKRRLDEREQSAEARHRGCSSWAVDIELSNKLCKCQVSQTVQERRRETRQINDCLTPYLHCFDVVIGARVLVCLSPYKRLQELTCCHKAIPCGAWG